MASLQTSRSTCDPQVGFFDVSCRELHQRALGRVALFVPEANEETFSIARVSDAGEAKPGLGDHPQLTLLPSDLFHPRSGAMHACSNALPLAYISPATLLRGPSHRSVVTLLHVVVVMEDTPFFCFVVPGGQ